MAYTVQLTLDSNSFELHSGYFVLLTVCEVNMYVCTVCITSMTWELCACQQVRAQALSELVAYAQASLAHVERSYGF